MRIKYIRTSAKLASILLLAFSLGACAYIVRGSKQQFHINTKPQNATVTLSNGMRCKTPCTLKLKRRQEFRVTIEKEGYHPYTTVVTSSINAKGAGMLAGNFIVAGGLVGGAVDAGTGAAYRLKPNPLLIKLARKYDDGTGTATAPNQFYSATSTGQ